MKDIFYFRRMEPAVTPGDIPGMLEYSGSCFDLHRVEWKRSYMATDGSVMLCWYQAPDTESGRMALRTLGSDMTGVWDQQRVHTDEPVELTAERINTLVEWRPREGSGEAESEAIASSPDLHGAGLQLVQSIHSPYEPGKLYLLIADSDAEVHDAFSGIASGAINTWSCLSLDPKS